ncbi:hypothetical protein CL658_04920 [bacterium]|nr:hypothetical protein [bacterium]|tara:strand:- start:2567 stop:3391 length:825 start_codon:yes stop_codon:yes gene_type:complete
MSLNSSQKKTNIQAITNAKLLSSDSDKILNIAIKNTKVIALGYLPDDDTIEEINACHHLIINNVFNIGSFIKNKPSQTEPNAQLKENPTIKPIDSYELVKHIHSQSLPPSQKCYVANVQISEFLFILQETTKTPIASHCHLILQHIDEETCSILNTLTLPDCLSLGIYLPTDPTSISSTIEPLILAKTITSVSCDPSSALSSLIMKYFPKNYPKICQLLFNDASKTIFKIDAPSIKIGNSINAIFIQKKEPYAISVIVTNGVIQTIQGDQNETR